MIIKTAVLQLAFMMNQCRARIGALPKKRAKANVKIADEDFPLSLFKKPLRWS
ncbi:hypothetical protein HNP81_002459 [Peribacillus huizhouensis]|uniref:Transposase n=1 Tax=Peribacillus huizhouensis TaxID=1501239 RepID=A0ABR6CQ70_9BACI|nr:hypothetical protein [Peribacillus huizhouensis]